MLTKGLLLINNSYIWFKYVYVPLRQTGFPNMSNYSFNLCFSDMDACCKFKHCGCLWVIQHLIYHTIIFQGVWKHNTSWQMYLKMTQLQTTCVYNRYTKSGQWHACCFTVCKTWHCSSVCCSFLCVSLCMYPVCLSMHKCLSDVCVYTFVCQPLVTC